MMLYRLSDFPHAYDVPRDDIVQVVNWIGGNVPPRDALCGCKALLMVKFGLDRDYIIAPIFDANTEGVTSLITQVYRSPRIVDIIICFREQEDRVMLTLSYDGLFA